MSSQLPRFTVRISPDLLKKFRIVADYNGRSANSELSILMREHVMKFVPEDGKIDVNRWISE